MLVANYDFIMTVATQLCSYIILIILNLQDCLIRLIPFQTVQVISKTSQASINLTEDLATCTKLLFSYCAIVACSLQYVNSHLQLYLCIYFIVNNTQYIAIQLCHTKQLSPATITKNDPGEISIPQFVLTLQCICVHLAVHFSLITFELNAVH